MLSRSRYVNTPARVPPIIFASKKYLIRGSNTNISKISRFRNPKSSQILIRHKRIIPGLWPYLVTVYRNHSPPENVKKYILKWICFRVLIKDFLAGFLRYHAFFRNFVIIRAKRVSKRFRASFQASSSEFLASFPRRFSLKAIFSVSWLLYCN